jgi:hypothetical protein
LRIKDHSGREVASKELLQELHSIAIKEQLFFPKELSVKSFAAQFNKIQSNLQEYFVINTRPGGGGIKLLTIRKKGDIDQPKQYDSTIEPLTDNICKINVI